MTKQKLADINLEDYLLQKIGGFSKSSSPLELDTDFFEFGYVLCRMSMIYQAEFDRFCDITYSIDSLQAAVIRSTIQKELDFGGKTLSSNIVFENPTVAQYVFQLRNVHFYCSYYLET